MDIFRGCCSACHGDYSVPGAELSTGELVNSPWVTLPNLHGSWKSSSSLCSPGSGAKKGFRKEAMPKGARDRYQQRMARSEAP